MSTQGYQRNKLGAINSYSIGNDKGDEKKRKKETDNEKKERP